MSLPSLKIHFALNAHGFLTTIEDVKQRGLGCNCVCIGCGKPLVARLGKVNRPHFAHHHAVSHCNYSAETDLHLAAKEYVRKHKHILAPQGFHEATSSVFTIDFVDVDYEEPIKPLREIPDLTGYTEAGEKIIVEIAVTHFCEAAKIARYKKECLTAIEFDLSGLLPWDGQTEEDLVEFFSIVSGTWLSISPVSLIAQRVIAFERKRNLELAKEIKKLEEQKIKRGKELALIEEKIAKKWPTAYTLEQQYREKCKSLELQLQQTIASHNEQMNALEEHEYQYRQRLWKLDGEAKDYFEKRKGELELAFQAELESRSAEVIEAYHSIKDECEELSEERDSIKGQLTAYEQQIPELNYIKRLISAAHAERKAIVTLEPELKRIAQSAGIPWPMSKSISQEIAEKTRVVVGMLETLDNSPVVNQHQDECSHPISEQLEEG